jgi:hypothetical protein
MALCAIEPSWISRRCSTAEGHAQLGLCHLGQGDATAALHHLDRATWLAPDEPLYHWNTAAAAHASDRRGACYLALSTYLDLLDASPGAADRRRTAQGFMSEYERLGQLEHPGVPPAELALTECGRTPPARRRPRRRARS